MTPSTKAPALHELGRRIKCSFWLKSLGIPGFMGLFFLGYFAILNNPFFEVTVMPALWVDRFVPYHNSAWVLYVSLWIYVQIPPTLVDDRRELLLYGATAAAASLVGFAFFFLWPTAVPPFEVQGADAALARICAIDTTGNSCPSLHVAFSVFTAVWIELFLRVRRGTGWLRGLSAAWALGIVYSTLGTKQHVFVDAVAGTVLGLASGWLQAWLAARFCARPPASTPILTTSRGCC